MLFIYKQRIILVKLIHNDKSIELILVLLESVILIYLTHL